MDIRKIALHLAGKLPPNYTTPNPSRFVRKVWIDFPDFIKESQLNFVQKQSSQSEDLYFMILDDIYRDNHEWDQLILYKKLLKELDVPLNLLWEVEKWKYTWKDYQNKLTKTFWSTPNKDEKWDLFEELCIDILKIIWGFTDVKSIWRWSDWWIDITAKKIIKLWDNTNMYLWFFGQCKYKTDKNVQDSEIARLTTTISNDSVQKYQGVFFFTNSSYAPNAKETLDNINHSTSNRKCFWLDGNDILDIINSNPDLIEKYS
jgi:hypothetical protein